MAMLLAQNIPFFAPIDRLVAQYYTGLASLTLEILSGERKSVPPCKENPQGPPPSMSTTNPPRSWSTPSPFAKTSLATDVIFRCRLLAPNKTSKRDFFYLCLEGIKNRRGFVFY